MEGPLLTALESGSNLAVHSLALLSVRISHLATSWLLQPQTGWRHFIKAQYADQTFRGLYKWNPFDAALLLPYFAVMIVLAVYGIHRYQLVYLYFKYRKNYNPESARVILKSCLG